MTDGQIKLDAQPRGYGGGWQNLVFFAVLHSKSCRQSPCK